MSVLYNILDIARQFLFVREVPGNHGQRVNAIQKWGGGADGDSWCAYWLTMMLDITYQGNAPIPRTGSCDTILAIGKANGWITTTPVPGDIYLRVRNGSDAHHCGLVTQFAYGAGHFGSISGNTNEDGSSNGDGVYEHDVIGMDGDTFIHIPD